MSKKLEPLALQEITSHGGLNYFGNVTSDELTQTANNTAQTITFALGTIPAGSYVHKVELRIHKPFRDRSDPAFNSVGAVVGDSDAANTFIAGPKQVGAYNGRAYADGVTNGTTTVTSATATFVAGDVGKRITGAGIPDGTTIASRNSGTSIELSAAATASATGVTLVLPDRVSPAVSAPVALQNSATGPYAADDYVRVTFSAMAAKALNDLDEGELHIYLQILNVNQLSAGHGDAPSTK